MRPPRLVDLLLHLPASVIDRRARPKIRRRLARNRGDAGSEGRPPSPAAAAHARARRNLVYASDDTGDVLLTFFLRAARLCRKTAARRRQSATSPARCRCTTGFPQIRAPRPRGRRSSFAKLSGIDPVYPLTEGLALGSLRRAIAQALQKTAGLAGMDQFGGDPPLQVSAQSRKP